METLNTFKKRKQDIAALIEKQGLRLDNKQYKQKYYCEIVGKALGLSHATVANYVKGGIGDGYLAEAILSELKKIK